MPPLAHSERAASPHAAARSCRAPPRPADTPPGAAYLHTRASALRARRAFLRMVAGLAMLAALAWPVQELLSPMLSAVLKEPSLVAETGGRK